MLIKTICSAGITTKQESKIRRKDRNNQKTGCFTLTMGGSDCFRSVYNPWTGQDKETCCSLDQTYALKHRTADAVSEGADQPCSLLIFYASKNPAEIEQNVSLISSSTRPCHSRLMNNNHLRYYMH